MKSVLYSVIAVFLLLSVAVATPDCGDPPKMERSPCVLIKPVDTVVGDEIIINCTEWEYINRWVKIGPLNVRVTITGYDDEDNPLQTNMGDLVDGEFTFIPRIAGGYLIKVGNDAQIPLEVGENPEAYDAPVAAAVAVEPEVVLPEPDTILPEPDAVEPEERGLLDFMVNGIEEEEGKEGVSGLMLMLVSLLIS